MEDSIFPIEDSIITATQGNRKDLVTRGNRGHMGNPGAEDILYNWLDKAVAELALILHMQPQARP